MLTMVSIDATDGLNEELSRSLSLQRKFLKRKRQRRWVCVKMRELPLLGPWVAKFSRKERPPRLCT